MVAGNALTLREYTAGFVLLTFTLGTIMSFSGGLFDAYDTRLTGQNKDTVKKLNRNIEKASPDIGASQEKVNDISTESNTFFLGSVLTVIETVTRGIGRVPNLANTLISGLNLTQKLTLLLTIPVIAVIYEVVSLYRGLRT